MKKQKRSIILGWLYPTLMSTYGDRGNVICLSKRCLWRGIDLKILRIDVSTSAEELKNVDMFFGGGAQDWEQEIVMRDLSREKGKVMKEKIKNNIPALFVCGAPQLMGRYYEPSEGKRIYGVEIFDMVSIHPGKNVVRCIGNIVAKFQLDGLNGYIVGFENHGGRTYLGKTARPFAQVVKGYGNNGTDGTEGVIYKSAIGCYFHGPLLPKNPRVADWLIKKALEVKYKEKIELLPLNDVLEEKAQDFMLNRLKI
jgi:hypothetical protein